MALHHRILIVIALVAGCGSGSGAPDAAVDDGGQDAIGGPEFGTPCQTSDDCGTGYCVASPTGNVCTFSCELGCPEEWNCRIREVAGALASVCVPQQFDFCTPCTDDVQCSGGVCVTLDGVSACLAECPFRGTCPTGYTCGSDPSGENPGRYCLPQTGTCACTVAEQGQVRTCTSTNALGTCRGVETCDADAGGWIGCSAFSATVESCDGLDDDCDQLIDEGVGSSACTNTVAGVGTCSGTTRCAGVAGETCEGPIPEVETCNYLDDDCDGSADNGFAGLSNVCSVGVGACQRFGVTRCMTSGTGTECSVVAGAPTSELCNGLNDDCDANTDEAYPTLGNACSAGFGICARQGNQVCNTMGTATVCSVTAGPSQPSETCNALDDDCDNKTDEGFRNQVSGQYDQDTACGSCSTDCTALYNLPNASGDCVVSGTPSCAMVCNANAFNRDGAVATGCEFLLDTGAVYVSVDDPTAANDASCGLGPTSTVAGHHPCLSIAQGIARATTLNRARVLVANGIYNEAVTLANGRSLLGGYNRDTWVRDVASTGTNISGSATIASTNHDYTVRATSITSATVFEGFVVGGSVNTKAGGNSYAIYVATSNNSLAIQNNVVLAGRGGPGANGGLGASGAFGVSGTGRDALNPAPYDVKPTTGSPCDGTNDRQYANGGVRSCGGNSVNGGAGGGNRCAPVATLLQFSAFNGSTGGAGSPLLGGAAGPGGEGGRDSYLNVATCFLPSGTGAHRVGFDGVPGADALHGPAVAGCSAATGSVVGGHWVGGAGPAGAAAGNGGGGGGGGAGGGAACSGCNAPLLDQLGAHGGGGGSGGCGGGGGGTASPGGGAFGIFITGGSAPVITGNVVQRGQGGSGGTGGVAGAGGPGGFGADGGTLGSSGLFCPSKAGRGGNGGDGGHGSGGGGACGGSSIGIYTSGVASPPNYCSGMSNTINGGAAGAGGAGGYSVVNQGGAGGNGSLGTCSFN